MVGSHGLTPNQLCGGGRIKDKGAGVREALPWAQACNSKVSSGCRPPGKPSPEGGRLVVTEEVVDTVASPSLSRKACSPTAAPLAESLRRGVSLEAYVPSVPFPPLVWGADHLSQCATCEGILFCLPKETQPMVCFLYP